MNTTKLPPIRIALAGLGKMGLSHQAIINMHPALDLVAVCDPSTYLLDLVGRYTRVPTFSDYACMLYQAQPEALVIATPSRLHEAMVRAALERGIDVFCEKPFCLDVKEGARLVTLAEARSLVTQVGYHNRFLGTFIEARRMLAAGAIGRVHHASVECYGPVMLRPKGRTWRTSRIEGGGCLYDYACHGIDLLNFLIGTPNSVSGSVLRSVFSALTDDEVYANLAYPDGVTAQLSANWSDESHRKMSTTVTLWGTNGKIEASRQELTIYLRKPVPQLSSLSQGWNTLYTTALTKPVWYYLRGEEYSAQIDFFVDAIRQRRVDNHCNFRSGHATDIVADMIRRDAADSDRVGGGVAPAAGAVAPARWGRALQAIGAAVRDAPGAAAKTLKGNP